MKNRMYAMAMAAIITCSSCDKDDNNTPTATFMPNTANSTWNYNTQTYAPTPATGSFLLKATNKDTTINNKTYRVFTNSSGANDYYAQVGTDYYQLANIGPLGGQRVEALFLKDAAVGTTWSEMQMATLPGIPTAVSVPVNYQIVKKGFDTTINAKAYTNVTHVKTTLGSVTFSGFPITPVSDLNSYYARGVGRIYTRVKIAVTLPPPFPSVNMDEEQILTSYTIQ